ncbi:MAG: hypothetical protein NE334_01410 [Lentisphaeraceae bacterium]|nr:hypothetical protein [Lentisphaeraceae bacterium]
MKYSVFLFFALLGSLFAQDKLHYIENGKLKLGINLSSGGSVFYLSTLGGKNLLNHYDRGRYIQQSYYGRKDGTMWMDQHWVWNPVQGGHYKGDGAKVLEYKKSADAIYVKSTPVHWASGEDLTDSIMEQWIVLKGRIVHIRYKFTYDGDEKHPEKTHEVPAVFVDSSYNKLMFYSGDKPWKDKELDVVIPGWPNKSFNMTESWAAYVNDEKFGLGVLSPSSKNLTCYRYIVKNKTGSKSADCSYFAPTMKSAIVKGSTITYDVFLTIGSIEKIRKRFKELSQNSVKRD